MWSGEKTHSYEKNSGRCGCSWMPRIRSAQCMPLPLPVRSAFSAVAPRRAERDELFFVPYYPCMCLARDDVYLRLCPAHTGPPRWGCAALPSRRSQAINGGSVGAWLRSRGDHIPRALSPLLRCRSPVPKQRRSLKSFRAVQCREAFSRACVHEARAIHACRRSGQGWRGFGHESSRETCGMLAVAFGSVPCRRGSDGWWCWTGW